MVDVFASSNFDLASGLSSPLRSGTSSPLRVDVPPTVIRDGLLLPAVLSPDQAELESRAVFSKEGEDAEQSDSDVYRGERPPSPIPRPPGADEISVASSSSSSSMNVGRRFGALANAVEAVIMRWGRTHSSASSTTSSSSSSISSTTRTYTARRRKGRRYSSTASAQNIAYEQAILARKKAQEEFRVIPRDFTLLLPSEAVPAQAHPSETSSEQTKDRRTIRTTSLPLILSQLDSALKKSAKSRRAQERQDPSDASGAQIVNKGKGKGTVSQANSISKTVASAKTVRKHIPPKCWWLDVASPSWDDLRSIGKLLHLHPLTLEDILHRDPREKLEVFPGLGYYFVVFRALESERSRERFRQFRMQSSQGTTIVPSTSADESVVGAVNVYIVVFSEGICSFHFEDITEHTEKLRNKILQMERTFDMTSDWIAHGLMDSIVDSFFPILVSIDKEVKEVDSLILEGLSKSNVISSKRVESIASRATDDSSSSNSSDEKDSSERLNTSVEEKGTHVKEAMSLPPLSVRISVPHLPIIHRVKGALQKMVSKRTNKEGVKGEEPMTSTFEMLLRIAAIRRIVTSLGRLLGTKGEVVAQIRKRLILASVGTNSKSLGLNTPSDGEVAIYMGDIQDHIVTLQQSLHHYERMLSHSHPAYLSQLRVSQSAARGGTDKAILLLTVVSITVLSVQLPLGLFSMNLGFIQAHIRVQTFSVFFAILGASILVVISVISIARLWYIQAKNKYSRSL